MRQKQFLLAFLAMLLCFAAPSFAENVAKIGGTEYATLAEAISNAAGKTIILLDDVTENVTISNSLTIDGAGNTYTGAMEIKADAIIKNVNFDGKGFNGYAITTRGAQYLTIEDCTAKNYGYGFVQLPSATALTTVKNVTVSNMNYGVKVDYSNAVVLENVDITAGSAAVLNSNYGGKTITIKDSKLSILGTWTRNNTIKTNYVFEGANSIGSFIIDADIDNFKLAAGATLTAPNEITVNTVEDYEVKYENGTYTSVEVAVATIGTKGYKTLAAALAAATAGQTITFVADVTEDVTISNAVTIDGAGKTYTGAMTLKANTTIKNVNFDGKGYNGYAITTRGANYLTIEDCTAKNYGYGFVQLASATALTTVKNATVSNMNYGVKVDYSGAVALENVDFTAGVAAVLNSNYGEKTISIKNSKLNILGTWTRNNTIKTTYVFEGANTIDQFKIDAAIDNFKLAGGATLTAPEGINVTTVEDYEVEYENGVYTSVEAGKVVLNDKKYKTFDEAYKAAKNGDVITLLETVVIDGGMWVNYSTKNITVNANFGDAAFRVQGNPGMVWFGGMTINSDDYCIIVGAKDGSTGANVDIYGGTYNGSCTAISVTKGSVQILDGTFKVEPYEGSYDYTINCIDSAYKSGDAEVSIKGGKFYNFNPGNNAAEGANTNFLTADYAGKKGEDGYYSVVKAVAEIGKVDYATLADAFNAVKDGEVITLCEDLTIDSETYTIADGKNVTLNMNGKKITVTDNKTANYELFYIYGGLRVNGNGTIELTATNNRAWNAMSAIFHNRGGVLNVENGTFKHLGGTDMAYVIDNSGNYYGDATTNVADGELSSSYIAIRNRMEQNTHGASGKAILNVAGGQINGTSRAIWGQAASVSTVAPATGEINVTGGNIGLIDVARSAGAETMTTISGGTVASFKGEVGELKVTGEGQITGQITIMSAAGEEVSYVVSAEGLYICATAKIGEQGYATLADAVAAAQAGETVTLIADATGAGVVIDKSITIDFNGKTYTANEGVGSTGTKTLGLQILKGNNVTLMNGTLTSEGDKVKMLVQNYANLTVKDMSLVDATDVIQYLLSNNSGESNIIGNTNITTDAVAFDVYDYTNYYTAPKLTVETTGTINGRIEVSETLNSNLVIKGGEFSADVTAWVAAGYKATKNAEGLYVVAIDPVAKVGDKYYASLREAVDAAPAGAEVTLLKNVTLKGGYADDPDAGLRIEKAITILGNKKTIDCGQFSKGIRIYINDSKKADVTFKNVTIKNDNPYGRCIDTRTKNIALEIKENTKLIAHGVNSQPLTVGGSSATYRISVSNATIDAGATGYGIISFVRVTNAIKVSSSSKISGLAAVYLKEGANNTSVELGNGTYTGTNKNAKESGAFGAIVIEGDNNTITLNNEKSVVKAVSANGSDKAQQAAFLVLEGATGNKIQITNAKAKVETTGDRAHFAMIHNASNTTIVENNANVQLAAECDNYQYRTFDEAYRASKNGSTVKLLANVNRTTANYVKDCDGYASIFNFEGRKLTFDLNGHAINVEADAADLAEAKGKMLMAVFSTDEGGKLTLKDSSEAKTGTVKVVANDAKVYSLITNYEDGCFVTIEGGNYIADKVYDSLIYSGASDCVTINNGNYRLDNVGEGGVSQNGKPWIFNALGQNQRNIDVNGGTFNADINHQYWCFEVDVPKESALHNNGDGTWTVVNAEAYVVEPKGKYTHEVGYPTLSEAIAHALDLNNTSVVMVSDVEMTDMITVANGKALTLDLNGKTIAATDNTSKNYSAIDNRGDLTIIGEGKMTVKATVNSGWNRYSAVIANNPGGKLTVNGGTIEHLGGTDMAYGIDNLTNGKGTYAETIINGGTIKSPYRAIRQFLNGVEAQNILTVNGGTIEGANKSIWMQDPSTNANTGSLTVGENAALYGNVYLTVTAGSTEWPVEVKIAKYALKDGSKVLSSNVPEGYAVSEYPTYWTVEALRLATLTIEDDCVSYQNVVEKQVGELTYVREFNDTEWQTICLPFAVPASKFMDQGLEVAYIYNASYMDSQATIQYVEIEDAEYVLQANYPYLIKAENVVENGTEYEIVVENAKLMPTEVKSIDCSTVFETFTFTGNYETIGEPCDPTTCNKRHFVMNDGEWTDFNGLKPFRVYMTIELRKNDEAFPTAQSINMVKVDKNGNVDTSVEKIGVDADILGIYDLQGRRVLEPQKGEIYIINGKKVVF